MLFFSLSKFLLTVGVLVAAFLYEVRMCSISDSALDASYLQMRHMFIIIDMSASMEDQDLKPTRLVASLKV